jgi:hypothetical protein
MTEKQFNSKLFWIAFLATLGIMVALGGCTGAKWCWRHFPPEIKTDTVKITKIDYRDTTVNFNIDWQHTVDEMPVVIIDTVTIEGKRISVALTMDSARARTEYAEAVAWVENSILRLELTQRDSLIAIRLDSVIAIKDHYVTLYTTEIHNTPPTIKCPWYSKILYLVVGFIVGGFCALLFRKLLA